MHGCANWQSGQLSQKEKNQRPLRLKGSKLKTNTNGASIDRNVPRPDGGFRTIMVHTRPHLDEIVGVVLLQRFAGKAFPGADSARVIFADKLWAVAGTIYVGVGGGEFDEHRPDGRLQDTCAAILVAQRLRILNKPNIEGLLHETLWADTQPEVFATQLANLIKTMHRVKNGKDQFGTYLWATAAIDALIYGKFDKGYDLGEAWSLYLKGKNIDPKKVDEITKMIASSYGRRSNFLTEFASIAAHMILEERIKWVPATFDLMIKDNAGFQGAVEELTSKGNFEEVPWQNKTEPMVSITSDNEYLNRAAASVKAGQVTILIVRNTNGLTQIFVNPKKGIDLSEFARMVRMSEYHRRTGDKLSVDRAWGQGTVREVPQWHFPNPNTLLNGSLTHPDVEPSKLPLEEVAALMKAAVCPRARQTWFRDYALLKDTPGPAADEAVNLTLG